jgi:hypothetical protein
VAVTSPTIPTSLRGHVSQFDDGFNAVLDELTQDLPADLVWPLSVPLYASMSRETHLSAIENAYTLQLRRAQWQLDGRGCRPEVVRLVADDMGLLVAGEDDPGGARTRGVSWSEHLRAALLCLRFGHAAFEMEADVSSGRARLTTLAERMPWTLSEIHVDPKTGLFLGVSQDQARLAKDRTPQIKADRMAFYCHERVGANWAGTSLFRSSYAPWLLKREMLRCHSIANRRWSAGVPVMEALAGTSPSSAQMQEAQEMASAARAGDQAGAASPPGFRLRIAGIEGALPDTLAFIEYLDRAMSKAALMGHIELGMGDSSGSRALASTLVESWNLALETIAEGVADTATRQIAARIVGWNFEDEPVPRVVVSGIGSRREVTAESLKLLLDSKALSSDPGLEAWIRREWRLPEREGAPTVAPSTDRVAASAGRVVRPKARRREAAGQLALPVMAAAQSREPTDLEQAAGTDFAAISAELEAAQAALAEQWPDLSEPLIGALVAAVVAAVAADTLADLGALVVPGEATAAMVAAVADAMVSLAGVSAGRAADELASQGVDLDPGSPDVGRLRDAAEAVAGVIASGYATGAGRVALQHAGPDADPDAVGTAVREHLATLSEVKDGGPGGWVATNLGGALAQSVAAGRLATFEQAPDGIRWAASAVNDRSVCSSCAADDGRVFDSLAEALEVFPAGLGGNSSCEGSLRCRCILVAVVPD